MAKQGMKHYYTKHKKKDAVSIPEISGKAKARNLVSSGNGKVYHSVPHVAEPKIPAVFPAIDNDLAVENLKNDFDMTAADLQDFE